MTRHKRSYGHPLHPDLTSDVLTCVLPLGTVISGIESEVIPAHLFLTIIQFFSACHLTSQLAQKVLVPPHFSVQTGNTLLTDKDAILKRWAEHFNSVLNRPSSVNDNAINKLPQIECNVLLDRFPTVTEARKAIQHLSSGKAPGTDAIPAEVYKACGLPMAEKLTDLFQCMWRKEAFPQDFKDASLIRQYKRKGNPKVCDNHSGISLSSIAGKILAKILLNRLTVILEKIVQFQYPKSWKMYLLGLQIKHVILKICNILTSDTKFYPHHFNIIRVTGC